MFSRAPLARDTKLGPSQSKGTVKSSSVQKPVTQKPYQAQVQHRVGKFKQQEEEEKKEEVPHGFTKMPSSKYSAIKVADPFSSGSKASGSNSFTYVYNAGGIPCRVSHGSVHLYLQWNKDVVIEELQYDPILVTCFEGLVEEKHPYNFIAKQAALEMLGVENSGEQVVPILQKLVWPLRKALSHSNDQVFDNALEISKQLSNSVGPNLNPHVKNLLVPIIKKANNKKYREKIYYFLHQLEENGGSDVLKVIKSSIPTYTNV